MKVLKKLNTADLECLFISTPWPIDPKLFSDDIWPYRSLMEQLETNLVHRNSEISTISSNKQSLISNKLKIKTIEIRQLNLNFH